MAEHETANYGEEQATAPPPPVGPPPVHGAPPTASTPEVGPSPVHDAPLQVKGSAGESTEVPIDDRAAGIPTDLVGDYGFEGANAEADVKSFENETACVGGILVASCVELAQAAQNCTEKFNKCKDEDGFAVAVGTISLFLCLCYLILLKMRRDFISKFTKFLSLFLLIWWSVGVIVLTFKHPFNTTGNGYFACWGAALLSIYYCQLAVEKLKVFGNRVSNAISGSLQRKLMMLLMFLSYVEAFAALILWDEVTAGSTKKQSKQEVWIFSCGIVSGGLATIYLLLEIFKPTMIKKNLLKYFSYFLVIWWVLGAGVATFDDPFPTTGNGYFCAWGAFVTSFYLAYLTTMAVTP